MVEKNNNITVKLPKTTLFLLGIALVLAGGVTLQEIYRQNQASTSQPSPVTKHFDFASDTIQAIILNYQGKTLKIYRGSETPSSWKMDLPETVEVSEPAVIFLTNLLGDSSSNRDFTGKIDQLADYGLAPPQATLVFQLKNGKTHQLLLGNADFKGDSLYSLIDPPEPQADPVKIALVSRSFADIVKRSPQDWRKIEASPVPKTLPQDTN